MPSNTLTRRLDKLESRIKHPEQIDAAAALEAARKRVLARSHLPADERRALEYRELKSRVNDLEESLLAATSTRRRGLELLLAANQRVLNCHPGKTSHVR